MIYADLGVQTALYPTTIFFMLECSFKFLRCEGDDGGECYLSDQRFLGQSRV